ncbi:NAD(P)-dependent oxidoreductase [Janibacter melonis]|uniref:NAD(P)-dependent oxidoreductase n=1 Tax=Janibacter melonis TaxID=262209 RepID=A0A176QGC5_9MICO|nr:SDR family oxidoreductase [Janibacter melonis]MBD5831848.1 SDR family oxidoreductase [Janibacter melonis]OAB88867.1 NAD(P)-dependent oxidoreductase [Janibacter melonis]
MSPDRADLSAIPPQTQDWPGTTAELDPPADHGESTWTGRERLTGRRALITGGDSGIGRAVAVTFAKEGADVAVAHLPQEQADAEQTKALVEAEGRRCVLLPADLRTHEANVQVARDAVEQLGGVDVLVCNAAYQMTHDELAEFPADQVVRTFETNVFGPFWLVRELADELAGGSVIVTTSIQAMEPSSHLLDYAATKAALNNLVVNLAAELGPAGTRVNAVAPGPIWTPLIPATMAADKVEGFGADTPLGRAGHPVEVAAAYVFLASDEASYVSGTVLGVTGGKPIF